MGTASWPIYFSAPPLAECSTVLVCRFFCSGRNEALGRKGDDSALVASATVVVSVSGRRDGCRSPAGSSPAGRTCSQPRQTNCLHARDPHSYGLPSI